MAPTESLTSKSFGHPTPYLSRTNSLRGGDRGGKKKKGLGGKLGNTVVKTLTVSQDREGGGGGREIKQND